MADFASTQAQLAAARAAQDAAQLAAHRPRRAPAQAQAALDLATRQVSPQGDQDQQLAQFRQRPQARAAADQAAANQNLQSAAGRLSVRATAASRSSARRSGMSAC